MGYRIFAIFFVVFGMWALMDGTQRALEGMRAKFWPVAPGRILIARYDQWRTKKGVRIAGLCVDIQYIYQVGDVIYDGDRVNTGWRCYGNQNHLEAILRRYPSGKKVDVYYNPEDPKRSLLEPGVDWTSFFLWGIGLISISAGLPLFMRSIAPWRSPRT